MHSVICRKVTQGVNYVQMKEEEETRHTSHLAGPGPQFHSVLMGVLPSGGGACAVNPAIMVGEHLLLRGAISQASNWKQPRRISF